MHVIELHSELPPHIIIIVIIIIVVITVVDIILAISALRHTEKNQRQKATSSYRLIMGTVHCVQ